MGRIKTKLVKRTAKELVEQYKDKFSNDFNLNKEVVKELADIPSKKLRNVIVGYISRLIKKQQE